MRILLPILLTWTLSQVPGCAPFTLRLYDAYIEAVWDYSDGYHNLPPTQTSFNLAPWKPTPGCAIAWRFPEALDINGQPLPDECQPGNFTADGQQWGGM